MGTGTTNSTGYFTIITPTDKVEAGNQVKEEVVDKAGKTGSTNENAEKSTYTDETKPELRLKEQSVISTSSPADGKADEVTIKGTSDEPNAQFTVKDKDGNTIGTGTTDSNGNFEITIPTDKVQAGNQVTVEVVDKAGNTGSDNENAGKLTYTDNTAPEVEITEVSVVDTCLLYTLEPTRHAQISYAVFCLKKKKQPSGQRYRLRKRQVLSHKYIFEHTIRQLNKYALVDLKKNNKRNIYRSFGLDYLQMTLYQDILCDC
ncbi:Ig-like domain-containing protein, partial [Aliarcobacter butzleri]|uniref:Ig-like domain-containing protein n=1 Tax=Aliarcobacter butzleri TaxID=28197 RepID=UPI00263F2006